MNESQMDELQLLRRTREHGMDPSEEELARGLARLERGIAESPSGARAAGSRASRRVRTRRAAWFTGVGVIAAGALAGAALVLAPAPVLGPVGVDDPHAQAAVMLERAAEQMLSAEAELQPGQFLRVSTRSEGISSRWDARTMHEGRPVSLTRKVSDTAWYFPADEQARWLSRDSKPYDLVVVYPTGDTEAERLVREETEAADAIADADAEAPDVFEHEWDPADGPEQRGVPADPDELRRFLVTEAEGMLAERPDSTEEDLVLELARSYATQQSQPREVRAAALRVLAESPRVSAGRFSGYDAPEQVSADASSISIGAGMTVSIEMSLAGVVDGTTVEVEDQLIFDEETARLIGSRMILTTPSDEYPGFPVGSVIGATSVRTSVVDGIPEVETWQ